MTASPCHPLPESKKQDQEAPGILLPNFQGLAASTAADARLGCVSSAFLQHREFLAPHCTLENTFVHSPCLSLPSSLALFLLEAEQGHLNF